MIDCLFNKRDFALVIKLGLLFHQGRDGWASELVAFPYWVVLVIYMVWQRSKERAWFTQPVLVSAFCKLCYSRMLPSGGAEEMYRSIQV